MPPDDTETIPIAVPVKGMRCPLMACAVKATQHGKPQGVVSDDQPDAREGQAGRRGVAERFVVCA